MPTCKARQCRFLAGDGITTSSLRGTEERVIGVVEDLLGRLSLALAATLLTFAANLLALCASISRTNRAQPLGLILELVGGAPMTDLRPDHGPNPDGKSHHDHRDRDAPRFGGRDE